MPSNLWENDEPILSYEGLDIEVPRWIEQDISPADVAAIIQGGCASGAYMPAVTYHQALATMGEHGDDVLDFIESATGDSLLAMVRGRLPDGADSWAGLACHLVSTAVELWASSVKDDLTRHFEDDDKAGAL